MARVRDIAERLGVAMPSVTGALKALAKRGLVNYHPYEVVTLSDPGAEVAAEINGRHETLARFLTHVLGVDETVAGENACRMEHALDRDVLRLLSDLSEFIAVRRSDEAEWLKAFRAFSARTRKRPARAKKPHKTSPIRTKRER